MDEVDLYAFRRQKQKQKMIKSARRLVGFNFKGYVLCCSRTGTSLCWLLDPSGQVPEVARRPLAVTGGWEPRRDMEKMNGDVKHEQESTMSKEGISSFRREQKMNVPNDLSIRATAD